MRARRRVSRGTSQRRRLVWARTAQLDTGEIAVSGVRMTNLLGDYETATGGDALASTIMAVRGRVWCTRENASTTPTRVAWGLIVAPSPVTTTADYDPNGVNGRHLDWMAREYVWMPAGAPVATSQTSPIGYSQTYDSVNVRSRRRLKEVGETLYIVTSRGGGAFNTGVFWAFDVLLALP